MKDDKSIGYVAGRLLGIILAACLTTCIGGLAIALTIKFLLFIF